MTSRNFRWIAGLSCLACCLQLILSIAGVTTGAATGFGFWVGRNGALIVIGVGLIALTVAIAVAIRRHRPPAHRDTQLAAPTRRR